MIKEIECRRLAKYLGWVEIDTLEGLQELGVPDAVHGESVWISPANNSVKKSWSRELNFDPWVDANDDLLILQFMKDMKDHSVWMDYKDCVYHETKGHGTHNVWDYKKGKFANAMVMYLNGRATGGDA